MPTRPILFILGTRSETIKALPVLHALEQRHPDLPVRVGATGQHAILFNQIAEIEGLRPAWNLESMAPRHVVHYMIGKMMSDLEGPIRRENPAFIVASGDSASTLSTSITAHFSRVPVAHLEAGLRGVKPGLPYPEQTLRKMVTDAAAWHFAPTEAARNNLIREGVSPEATFVCGDPGQDSLAEKIAADGECDDPELRWIDWSKPIALSTVARRENHGDAGYVICEALMESSQRHLGVQFVHVNHLNPHLLETFWSALKDKPNMGVTSPLPRKPFIHLLRRATFVITDSGGVQEEASALGIPLVSLRASPECGRVMGTAPIIEAANDRNAIVDGIAKALGLGLGQMRPANIMNPQALAAPKIADQLALIHQQITGTT